MIQLCVDYLTLKTICSLLFFVQLKEIYYNFIYKITKCIPMRLFWL